MECWFEFLRLIETQKQPTKFKANLLSKWLKQLTPEPVLGLQVRFPKIDSQ